MLVDRAAGSVGEAGPGRALGPEAVLGEGFGRELMNIPSQPPPSVEKEEKRTEHTMLG